MPSEQITKSGVLVVDPQTNMAALVGTMLRALNRRDIREVNDANQAMAELRRRPFDLLILDDAIGGTDAVELVRRLRTDTACQNRHVPVIMMAAAPDTARIAAARDAGVTEFLRKPFAANHLKARLDSIESRPRAFIEAATYAGPDRRRRSEEPAAGERRSR
jgi:two-component system, chemotaxis family, chemotaxis protein CheY